ncbi:hypothetical protein ALT_4759 [Aspergillus lentulus]|uniref:Uncharacterized protein n=1 Tax=Aspergillus lentulus TaxID=293939 RepID=A0AAN4PJU9_ASPLE|nr:uncharacterized protein IFM58399_02450 [Aspergillus lentulus]KAF4151931.1 hypothetical protein CNMCM6069_002821 [Aspergillus lentulus]KAF4161883.1 hypothetical protein CNMCM6936_002897 [Aspergillus lentulus]KAF4171619.1 hypothetical protein CNMCM8060_002657 [Aspergillus lentulus]KAF4178375.1 hypothetical protein CNMCM7927_002498 [Aspergillus lentulus]KAF4191131.1 hypothetical protein CNMCM8694_002327 [Aspergillus lentulus]
MAELSKEAIILIVIVGCVVSVLIGYSIHYISTGGFRDDQTEKDMTYEQKEYMRGLRLKNMEMLAGQARVKVPRDQVGVP